MLRERTAVRSEGSGLPTVTTTDVFRTDKATPHLEPFESLPELAKERGGRHHDVPSKPRAAYTAHSKKIFDLKVGDR
jgi:hypothetical protein